MQSAQRSLHYYTDARISNMTYTLISCYYLMSDIIYYITFYTYYIFRHLKIH